MSLGKPRDLTYEYKQGTYNIQLDVSGWDYVFLQTIQNPANPIGIYGTLNGGDLQGVRDGSPVLATDWTPIQAVKMSDNTRVSSLSGAGLFRVDNPPQYLRFGAGGADVYQFRAFFSKIS